MPKISLGLIRFSGVLLSISTGTTSGTAPSILCYRFICEDSLLFILA